MIWLFGLLFLLFLAAFPLVLVGLIKPKLLRFLFRRVPSRKLIIISFILVLFGIGISMGTLVESDKKDFPPVQDQQTTPASSNTIEPTKEQPKATTPTIVPINDLRITRNDLISELFKYGVSFTQGQPIRQGEQFAGEENYNSQPPAGTSTTIQIIGSNTSVKQITGTMFFGDNSDENHRSFLVLGALTNAIDPSVNSWLDNTFADGFKAVQNGQTSYKKSIVVNGRKYTLELSTDQFNSATLNIDIAN